MILTTNEVLHRLREANPESSITEDRVRHLIRRGVIDTPSLFGGRYAWNEDEVAALADALECNAPAPDVIVNPLRPRSIVTGGE